MDETIGYISVGSVSGGGIVSVIVGFVGLAKLGTVSFRGVHGFDSCWRNEFTPVDIGGLGVIGGAMDSGGGFKVLALEQWILLALYLSVMQLVF